MSEDLSYSAYIYTFSNQLKASASLKHKRTVMIFSGKECIFVKHSFCMCMCAYQRICSIVLVGTCVVFETRGYLRLVRKSIYRGGYRTERHTK